MFAPLSRFFRRPDPAEADRAFIAELRVSHPREPRSRRSEWVLLVGWILVLAKCAAVWWLCRLYPDRIKFGPGWIIVPSLMFATLCTVVYWRRD